MEKNEKDSNVIAVKNQSSSREEYDGTSDSNDRSSINFKSDKKAKVKALQVDIQRLMEENKDQQMFLQIFYGKEYAFKEQISDIKFQLQERMNAEVGMRKWFNELKVECQSLKEELERLKISAQVLIRKVEDVGASIRKKKTENIHPCMKKKKRSQ